MVLTLATVLFVHIIVQTLSALLAKWNYCRSVSYLQRATHNLWKVNDDFLSITRVFYSITIMVLLITT